MPNAALLPELDPHNNRACLSAGRQEKWRGEERFATKHFRLTHFAPGFAWTRLQQLYGVDGVVCTRTETGSPGVTWPKCRKASSVRLHSIRRGNCLLYYLILLIFINIDNVVQEPIGAPLVADGLLFLRSYQSYEKMVKMHMHPPLLKGKS
jgi:hypothetical protein